MTLNAYEFNNLLTALPALRKIYNSGTLKDYFQEELADFLLETDKTTPDTALLLETIYEETARLYDKQTAKEVVKQLSYLPIMESGTHLAFLRDYDSPQKEETRALLNQNILISASLMKQAGAKYHIGFYGSNVSLSHPCSGGYFQVGDTIFPVANNNKISKSILYQSDKISSEYFNETVLLSATLNHLEKTLNTILKQENCPCKEKYKAALKIVSHLTATTNLKNLQTAYSSLKEGKKQLIEETKQELNLLSKRMFDYSFDDIKNQYQALKSIFEQENLSTLADQTAVYQSYSLNQILNKAGMQQITLDGTEITRKFLIKALQSEDSIWSKIFSNPTYFNKFQQSLKGIRAAWKEDESPFVGISKDKEMRKSFAIKLHKLSHDKETVLELLKTKQIAPSSALICLATQSANILAHGGFFQSTYAEKMKQGFQGFLTQIHENKLKEKLDVMPVDLMFLSLGVISESKTKKPLKLSEIARLPEERLANVLNVIPYIGAAKSVLATAGILNTYLNNTAPGYIEAEALKNKEKLVQKISKYPEAYKISFKQMAHLQERGS